ncbi:MAG: carboxypeptidase-like regulatory domain-containing protein [Bryobacteraceae bacterium]
MIRLFLLLALCAHLCAQGDGIKASLTGTILDAAGAVVPDALVILSSREAGIVRRFTSDEGGRYAFPLIPPGDYQLRVQKLGFKVCLIPDISLEIGQVVTVDPQLTIGLVTQSIVVEEPLLNRADPSLGSRVGAAQLKELPLNIRNAFGLVALDSSVNNAVLFQALNATGVQGNADQDIAFFNFGGGRFGTTAFLLDGHWNGAGDWAGIIFVPSVDELQEFRVQTHTFSPQYGWSMGNVVNAITKSGSSSFHGSAFEFARNSVFDANNFFNNRNGLARPDFHRNQFGLTAGGPLYLPKLYRQRHKTFLFGAYEGLRQQTPTTLVTSVPTAAQRRGDFSQTPATIYNPFATRIVDGIPTRLPFAGNKIPGALLDPVALATLAYYPLANRPGNTLTGANNFVGAAALPTDSDQYTLRTDHNINADQRLFARWSQKRQFKQLAGEFLGADNPGGNSTIAPNNRMDGAFGYSIAVSPSFVVSANIGFGRWVEARKPQGVPFTPSSLGLPSTLDSFSGPSAFPGLTIVGYNSLGSGVLNATPREARTLSLDTNYVHGSHLLSFGMMAVDLRLNTANSSQLALTFSPGFTQGPTATSADPRTGSSMASFLLGTADNNEQAITWNASAAYRKTLLGTYFNDDWKLRGNLTVNLGLRYDYQTAPTDRFDRLSYWTLQPNPSGALLGRPLDGAVDFTGGTNPRGVYNAQKTNLAPRVGISYSLSGKLVMRAGFGMFYTPAIEFGDYQGLSLNGFTQSTPYVGSVDGVTPKDLLRNPFPNGLLLPPGKALGALTNVGGNVNAVERARPTPYVEQWTYGWRYEVSARTVVELNYLGNHGVKLPFAGFQRNQLSPEFLSLGERLLDPTPNPFFGAIATGPLSGPTIPLGQLLRPYPQFLSVTGVQPPAGMSTYHALSLSVNRRFYRGLQYLVSFTASKYLTNTEGYENWATGSAAVVRNWYDTSLEKSLMSDDVPRSLVGSFIYEIPATKGKRALVGGWQLAGIATLKSGFPLAITTVSNNTNSFGGGQRPNLVGDPHVSQPSADAWFNTAAFAQPPPFTFGSVGRTMPDLRAPGIFNLDLTLQRNLLQTAEGRRLQLRAEFYNLANRTNFYAPNTQLGDPNFGVINNAMAARSIQLGVKFYW